MTEFFLPPGEVTSAGRAKGLTTATQRTCGGVHSSLPLVSEVAVVGKLDGPPLVEGLPVAGAPPATRRTFVPATSSMFCSSLTLLVETLEVSQRAIINVAHQPG